MKKILLDTNFLLIPWQLKVDIFSEIDRIMDEKYKLYIIDKTIDELQKIIETQKTIHKEAAKFALELIIKYNIQKIDTLAKISVDDLIVGLANAKEYIVCTQDKLLKKRLKDKKVPLFLLRQKKYLIKS